MRGRYGTKSKASRDRNVAGRARMDAMDFAIGPYRPCVSTLSIKRAAIVALLLFTRIKLFALIGLDIPLFARLQQL